MSRTSSSARRSTWRLEAVEFAVGRDEAATLPERQPGQPACHEFVRVLAQRDVGAGIAQQPGEPVAHLGRARFGALPLVVHQLRRIEPGLLLRLERHVGPGLVGMAGQQQAFGHAEARVVPRERVHSLRPDVPQVRKEVLAEGGSEITGAGRSAGARLRADRPLHHLHVAISPFLDAFVEIDEALAELRVLGVVPVDVDEHLLDASDG